ncbi:MAG: hypothetical protein NVS2B11_18090 [Acetobacteraceae bacterium]
MNDVQTAKFLGWFSVGLGAAELILGRRMNRALGLGQSPALVRAFGAREVASGAMVLMYPDMAAPIWLRVAGDALDLAVLARALKTHNRRRQATLASTLAVLGVTALDVMTAASLSQRHGRALATARRTRVQRA